METLMDLNITRFFNEACPKDYSASQAEIGDNAAMHTWNAACDDFGEYPLLDNDEKRNAFRRFVRESGGWTEEEIVAWSNRELNALCIQWVSGDIREFRELAFGDWDEWRALCEAGTCSGRLYGGPLSADGQIYFGLD
jgi:hypothetical protein